MGTVLMMDELIHVVKLIHLSEPELRDEDVNVDDVLTRVTLGCQVAHGQFEYGSQRTNERLHLSNNT